MDQQGTTHSEATSPKEVVFPNGIPGFEHLKHYRLEQSDTASVRLFRLCSRDEPDVVFTLVDPKFYSLNYVLELTDEEQALLQAEDPEEVAVLLMLWKADESAPDRQPGLHANIDGPILINVKTCLGMQKLIPAPRVELNILN